MYLGYTHINNASLRQPIDNIIIITLHIYLFTTPTLLYITIYCVHKNSLSIGRVSGTSRKSGTEYNCKFIMPQT